MRDLVRLSKTISYALRHNPTEFGITLDEEGWASLVDLMDALRGRYEYRDVTLVDIEVILTTSNKKRFELDVKGGRIRAYYGHSIREKIVREPKVPPQVLYHGTSPETVNAILEDGLKPMSRQSVHLTTSERTAEMTGRRKHPHPVILVIDAQRANQSGIKFYPGNEDIWLSDPVPAEYISVRE